jgi:DUF917 family protein
MNPFKVKDVSRLTIMDSYSKAWHLGHAVLQAHRDKKDPVLEILRHEKGSRILIKGKVSFSLHKYDVKTHCSLNFHLDKK